MVSKKVQTALRSLKPSVKHSDLTQAICKVSSYLRADNKTEAKRWADKLRSMLAELGL